MYLDRIKKQNLLQVFNLVTTKGSNTDFTVRTILTINKKIPQKVFLKKYQIYWLTNKRSQALDNAILLNPVEVYSRAKAQNPSRWPGEIKNWDPIKEVLLNPEKSKNETKENKVA